MRSSGGGCYQFSPVKALGVEQEQEQERLECLVSSRATTKSVLGRTSDEGHRTLRLWLSDTFLQILLLFLYRKRGRVLRYT